MIYVIGKDTVIAHHGVLGMKWGIRRYQPYGIGYASKAGGKFIGKVKQTATAIKDANHAKNLAVGTKRLNKRLELNEKRYNRSVEKYSSSNPKKFAKEATRYNAVKESTNKILSDEKSLAKFGAKTRFDRAKRIAGIALSAVAGVPATWAGMTALYNGAGKLSEVLFDAAIENLSPALYMASESVYKIVEFMEGLAEEEIYGIMALNTAASVNRSVKKYRETKR